MDEVLHNHAFNEVKEGYVQQNKVIVDVCHKNLFKNYKIYDECHIVVDRDEFEANGGIYRFVAINRRKNNGK